ncbi:MAG: cytidine deaminase [Candidatus Dormibacteria bacterium]
MAQAEPVDWITLRATAKEVARRAYAPWSKLHVGAAGLTDQHAVISGCNVENASFGLSLCAECGLVSALRAQGGERIVALSVVTEDGLPLAPCGRCRQVLLEHGGPELPIDQGENAEPITLGELLPGAFDPSELARRQP